MNKMKNLIKAFFVALFCFSFSITSWSQKQTKKIVEDAIKSGQFEVYIPKDKWGISKKDKICEFKVSNCFVESNDFYAFFAQNPQYQIGERKETIEHEFKYRREYTYVHIISFSFQNNKDVLSCLELCVRSVNKNLNLKLPFSKNVNEVNTFYQKYVAPFPKAVDLFNEEFLPKYREWLINDPEAVKQLCKGSPYPNNDFVKTLDVWQILCQCNKKYDYVYFLTTNNGYYFDKNGAYNYQGQIGNGMPNGQGQNMGWEGTYVNGKKNGAFTHRYSDQISNQIKSTGICVDDEWDGEVVKETTNPFYQPYSNIEKEYYSQGKLIRTELVSDQLTKEKERQTRLEMERRKAEEREAERRRAQREAEKRAEKEKLSSLNVNNIMKEVESIEKKDEDRLRIEYSVRFKDYRWSEIYYNKHDGKWEVYEFGLFYDYYAPEPNSKEAAILLLYQKTH